MKLSKLLRWGLPLLVLAGGIYFLMLVAGPTAESVSRQQAIEAYGASNGNRVNPERVTAEQVVSTQTVRPTVVNLKDIPAGVYDPNNQLDRWKRGEIDLDEKESIVSEAEVMRLRAEAARLQPSVNVQQAAEAAGLTAATAGTAFDSIDYTECCGGGGNVPPDPELAVGPNHVIAVVNVAFEIYNKQGVSLVGPTTFASFMAADPNCTGVFDPNAIYDESTDRYILGIDADGTHYCLAVSQTGDPTGSWNIYSFQTGSSRDFFDYPHAGVGNDAIYMGANIFRCTRFGCSFKEARVWAFNKAQMVAGQPATAVTVGLGSSPDTPQPLNLHGWNQGTWPSGGPHYFFSNATFDGANYTVYSWNDPFGANTFATVGTVNLVNATGVSAGLPVDTPQLGGQTIQANDFRPQDFEYRNGFAWTATTIACNPGGGTVNCVRWAKINPANATVVDAGVYASNGQYRTFADLAVDACNNMQIGYTKSSSSMYPGIYVTGRLSTDPAGTLQAEALMKAGEIAYTSFETSAPRRWGDYTEMTIDPAGTTFWYLGEYSKNTGTSNGRWGTYIGSFSYGCNPGNQPTPTPTTPPPTPTPTATPQPGGTVHVGDLDNASTTGSRNRWNAVVVVTVHDGNDAPAANATVNGSWSSGATGSGSCVTNGSGQCSITKSNLKGNVSSVTFTVTNVTAAGSTYTPGANHDPDGDSNGTTITLTQP